MLKILAGNFKRLLDCRKTFFYYSPMVLNLFKTFFYSHARFFYSSKNLADDLQGFLGYSITRSYGSQRFLSGKKNFVTGREKLWGNITTSHERFAPIVISIKRYSPTSPLMAQINQTVPVYCLHNVLLYIVSPESNLFEQEYFVHHH